MSSGDWITVIQVLVGAIGTGGFGMLIRAMLRRRPNRQVELSKAAMGWTEKFEESTQRAWKRAEEAEAKADAADRTADDAVRKANAAIRRLNEVVSYLNWIVSIIHEPGMDMARLRAMVPPGSPKLPEE